MTTTLDDAVAVQQHLNEGVAACIYTSMDTQLNGASVGDSAPQLCHMAKFYDHAMKSPGESTSGGLYRGTLSQPQLLPHLPIPRFWTVSQQGGLGSSRPMRGGCLQTHTVAAKMLGVDRSLVLARETHLSARIPLQSS